MNAILSLALCLLFIAAASAQPYNCPSTSSKICNTDTSIYPGYCQVYGVDDEFCNCRSGYSGADCSVVISGSCTPIQVTNLTTEAVPIGVNMEFVADRLNITVKSPYVAQRNATEITLNNAKWDDSSCSYPGRFWSKSFVGDGTPQCEEQYYGNQLWTDINGCGWTEVTSDPNYYIYTTDMIIRHHDFIWPFGGRPGVTEPTERLTQHVVPLEVQFQKVIDVTSSIVIQAPVRLLGAITQQSVAGGRSTATIAITTNLLYPYKLDNAALTVTGGSFSSAVTETTPGGACPDTPGSACDQVWTISITSIASCTLTADYKLDFDLICRLDGGNKPASCAINDGATATLTADISTEDFCPKVSVRTGITGTLKSYDSAALNFEKTNFLVDQTIHFLPHVDSDNATVTKTTVTRVTANFNGGEEVYVLYDADTQVDVEEAAVYTVNTAEATTTDAPFSIELKSSYISGIAVDSSKTYLVTVTLEVEFSGVPIAKRVTLQGALGRKEVALGSQVGITAPEEHGSASSVAPWAAAGLIGLFAASQL